MSDDISKIPSVIPMTQVAVDSEGKTVIKRVRPLTYALMSFVKVNLELKDTIDITDDEANSQWEYDDISEDENLSTKIYIDVSEDLGMITLNIYPTNIDISSIDQVLLKDFILKMNLDFYAGQLQLMNGYLRYHSSIDVEGIASDDPNYEGPHLVHPRLILNMFTYGRATIRKVIVEIHELLNDN